MGRLTFRPLTEAWKGEATDFTPLIANQLDSLGEVIGVNLASYGESEVPSAGGRRIDIVASVDDGTELVIENQYGRADHDHLTRGLAYAVARRARGLVVVAEEHRDEFRAVAQYLNELAEHDPERGIAVWLVEARAVRIGESPWAPLFTAVVEPNSFTARVEQTKQAQAARSLDELYALVEDQDTRDAIRHMVERWTGLGHRRRLASNHVVLEARGPATGGVRAVVALFVDGRVLVPFNAYAGVNTGVPIDELTTDDFRRSADALFGFAGTEKSAKTVPGWLTTSRVNELLRFCEQVAAAYERALVQRDE